jgi:hypothetical protein
MATRLTDGTPLSFEWLNSLVDEINSLAPASTSTSGGASEIIRFFGSAATTNKHAIVIDKFTGTMQPIGLELDVVFPAPFADNKVIVVPTIESLSITGARQGKPIRVGCSIGAVTATGFKLSVFNEETVDTTSTFPVTVHYIAIGNSTA